MAISITQLYQLFVEKTDKETAEAVTSYVERKVEREVKAEVKSHSKDLATKGDLYAVKEDLYAVKEDLQKEISSVKEDLQKEIGKKHAETIKWMFVFWIGTMGTIIALLKFL